MNAMTAPYEGEKQGYLDEVPVPIEMDLRRASDAIIRAMVATLDKEDPDVWAQEAKSIVDYPDKQLGLLSQNEDISLAVDKSFAIARISGEGVYALRTPLLLYLLGKGHPDE